MKKPKSAPRQLFALALAANALMIGGLTLGPGCGRPALAQAAAKAFVPVPASEGASREINAEGYKAWAAIVRPRIMALAGIDGVKRPALA